MFSLNDFSLKYHRNGLTPYMSEETMNYHYGKHLDAYINNLNTLIAGTPYAKLSLDEIIIKSATDDNAKKIFNNAAQIFNHQFFFDGMARDKPATIPQKIIDTFGTYDNFVREFTDSAMSVFGSGWTWLVEDKGVLKIMNTANADTPIAHGMKPLLTLDIWEHAYYLDHQNRRANFVDTYMKHLIDWDVVNKLIIK